MKRKTHEEFIVELKIKNSKMYEELEFLEEYKGLRSKILAKDKYGKISTTPDNIYAGYCPTISSAVNKHEYFLNMLKEKNPVSYKELEFLEKYKNGYTKILAKNKYGEIMANVANILQGHIPTIKSAVNKTAYLIAQFREIHGDRYDYSEVMYDDARTKVKIICKKHKSFFQIPDSHIGGRGCPNCIGRYEEKYTSNEIPTYDTFASDFIFVGMECRRDPEDNNILNVRCHLCEKWFTPSYGDATNKKSSINGKRGCAESNLYCSELCKKSCSTYYKSKFFDWQSPPKSEHELSGFYDSSTLKTWSKQIKDNANNTCEKCGSVESLCSHHIEPKSIAPELALDPDNGICLCKDCHMELHRNISGCGLGELRQCKIK